MSAPATAVVFDLGGVITESPLTAFAAYEAEAGLPEGLIVRLNSTDPDTNAWARFERSELDAAGFADAFEAEALAAGHRLDADRVLAAEVVERYGIAVEGGDTIDSYDDAAQGWPGGDLDVFADAGLPAEELTRLLDSDELWADELVLRIADRLGFADELAAAAAA